MPDTAPPPDSVQSQILLKLGEMATDIAVIKKTLESMPDHELRIRELRADVPPGLPARLQALELIAAQGKGGRDVAARVWATLATVMAAGSTTAAWVVILRK